MDNQKITFECINNVEMINTYNGKENFQKNLYSKSSQNVIDRFCDFKQSEI